MPDVSVHPSRVKLMDTERVATSPFCHCEPYTGRISYGIFTSLVTRIVMPSARNGR